jgi:hypothetical protein
MLVDLARNDVNRVCDPLTVRVDQLMVVQKVIQHDDSLLGWDGADLCSSPTCSILCLKCLEYFGRIKLDSTPSGRSFLRAL